MWQPGVPPLFCFERKGLLIFDADSAEELAWHGCRARNVRLLARSEPYGRIAVEKPKAIIVRIIITLFCSNEEPNYDDGFSKFLGPTVSQIRLRFYRLIVFFFLGWG